MEWLWTMYITALEKGRVPDDRVKAAILHLHKGENECKEY